jgi:hypothetical protein
MVLLEKQCGEQPASCLDPAAPEWIRAQPVRIPVQVQGDSTKIINNSIVNGINDVETYCLVLAI